MYSMNYCSFVKLAKEISVFDYTQVIFAAILGMLFLVEVPTVLSFIGYAVIIGVAVFRWRYNLKEKATILNTNAS